MRIRIIPASPATPSVQVFTTYVIDGTVAIDAGCLHNAGSLADLARIRHVFLSHSHMDHVAALGPFVDAVYDGSGDCVTVYGGSHTLDALRRDLFNDRTYPDFPHLSTQGPPFLKLVEVRHGEAVCAGGLRVTPVEVRHTVPSFGFVVEGPTGAAVFSSDTGPTEALWDAARACAGLRAAFVECTFPESMTWLAEVACHLTPSLFAAEMRKLGRADARTIAVHVHPRHAARVREELASAWPTAEVAEAGAVYEV